MQFATLQLFEFECSRYYTCAATLKARKASFKA